MLTRDMVVFVAVVAGFAWATGMQYGTDHAIDTCQPQPGATLVSTIQDHGKITCEYAASLYGRARFNRRAAGHG